MLSSTYSLSVGWSYAASNITVMIRLRCSVQNWSQSARAQFSTCFVRHRPVFGLECSVTVDSSVRLSAVSAINVHARDKFCLQTAGRLTDAAAAGRPCTSAEAERVFPPEPELIQDSRARDAVESLLDVAPMGPTAPAGTCHSHQRRQQDRAPGLVLGEFLSPHPAPYPRTQHARRVLTGHCSVVRQVLLLTLQRCASPPQLCPPQLRPPQLRPLPRHQQRRRPKPSPRSPRHLRSRQFRCLRRHVAAQPQAEQPPPMTSTPQNTPWPCRSMQQQHGSSRRRVTAGTAQKNTPSTRGHRVVLHADEPSCCSGSRAASDQISRSQILWPSARRQQQSTQSGFEKSFGKTGPVNIMWRSNIEQKSKMIQVFRK